MNDDGMIVTETFVSVQGEGPLSGQRCAFLRLSRCNLDCSWCDTPETWDWTRFAPADTASRRSVSDVAEWVVETGVDLLVVTGGEPLLQQPALDRLLRALPVELRVQVETNGTRIPAAALVERVDLWVVSPKLATSGVATDRRVVPDALVALVRSGRAVFKFVVSDPTADVAETAALADRFGLAPVWLMPEGTTVEQVVAGTALLVTPAARHGWNLSTRLHVLAGVR